MNDSLIQSLSKNADKDNEIMANYVGLRFQREGYRNIIPIDCGSLTLNKQHNITEFLKNNLSRAEIKATQVASIDTARKGVAKLGIDPKMKNMYGINDEDYDIHISDAIKYGENVGVVLSCTANDLMWQTWINPISYFLGSVKQSIPFMQSKTLKRLQILLDDEKLRDNVTDGLKRNIEEVLGINSNAKIVTMGIFRPRITPEVFNSLFEEINYKAESITKSYDQSYVDISDIKSKPIDFHPTGENYMIMQERVFEEILKRFRSYQRNVASIDFLNYSYSNLGLLGARNQVYESISVEQEKIYNFISEIINKYNYSREEVEYFMQCLITGRIEELKTHASVYEDAEMLIKR
jgi:hypothetical protein